MFPNTRRQEPVSSPGLIAIAADGTLQMKLCWTDPGDVDHLMHVLRDKCITAPADVFKTAVEYGFDGLLLLTRTGRITEQGESKDPLREAEQDEARKQFHNDTHNPLGTGTAVFMDMSNEFQIRRNEELRRAPRR